MMMTLHVHDNRYEKRLHSANLEFDINDVRTVHVLLLFLMKPSNMHCDRITPFPFLLRCSFTFFLFL
jgi:hypothetical protein